MGISMKDFPLCSLDCQKILLPRKSKQKMYRMQKKQMELSKQTKKGKKQNLWKESDILNRSDITRKFISS